MRTLIERYGARLALVVVLFTLPSLAWGHVDLDAPHAGTVLTAGSTYLIEWHVVIAHATLNWDLEYSLTGTGGPWLPIATDLPVGDPSVASMHSYLWVVPETPSTQVRVRVRMDNSGTDYYGTSNGDLSIVLPLAVDVPGVSLSAGGTQNFALDAGSDRGGMTYLLVGTASGTTPGQSAGGFVVPLEPDFYFGWTLAFPNAFPLAASFGVLDGSGSATASFSLPPGVDPILGGVVLHHAFIVADATPSLVLASNAVAVTLNP